MGQVTRLIAGFVQWEADSERISLNTKALVERGKSRIGQRSQVRFRPNNFGLWRFVELK